MRIVVVAVVSVILVLVITALAVALAPPRPPGSIITETSWQWTRTTPSADVDPLVVSDPQTYTIEFMGNQTFQVQADCNTISGTYQRILPGRIGTSWTGLGLSPAATSLVACSPESLSGVYLRDLETAARYLIDDGQLVIALRDGRLMIFRAAAPAVSQTPGA